MSEQKDTSTTPFNESGSSDQKKPEGTPTPRTGTWYGETTKGNRRKQNSGSLGLGCDN